MATFPLKPAGAKNVGVTYKMARLPAAVAPVALALSPLTWNTGTADEVFSGGYWSTFVFGTAVAGSWPEGTEFVWDHTDETGARVLTMGNALFIFGEAYAYSYGVETISVTVTAPDGTTQTLGPITLSVVSSGCC